MAHRHIGGKPAPVARFVGHLDHLGGDIDLPAMENAAQRAAFVPGQCQRGAAVRAGLVEKADPAIIGAKGDKIIAEQADADGIAGDGPGADGGNPVMVAHHLPHWRIALNAGQDLVFFLGEHGNLPSRALVFGQTFHLRPIFQEA